MYSVGVSNIFELLGEEGQEGKNVNLARAKTNEPAQQSSSKQPAQPSQEKTAQKKSDAPAKGNQPPRSERGGFRGRGGRGGFRGGRGGDRPPRVDGGGVPTGGQKERSVDKKEDRTREERQREKRENERGEHLGRGKRVYERRSGTGRGREVKKGGAGKGGWGTPNDEGQLVNEETGEHPEEDKGTAEAPTEGTEGKAEAEPQPPKELTEEEKKKLAEEEAERAKEEKMMTLEEYKKKKEEDNKKLAALALPAPRRAGEGEQKNKEWEKYVVLSRDDVQKVEDSKKDDKKKESKKGVIPVDQVLEIKTPPPYGKKPRDDNYKPRGGGRGGKRGGKKGSVALDNQSFPPLSTKA